MAKSHVPEEITQAIEAEKPSHIFAMFSGGHDSVCSTHIASELPGFSGVIHCNTGIGIKETRDYVVETCERFDWPLHELHPDVTYEELVLEGRRSKTTGKLIQGFPCGPMSHNTMLFYLKEKPLRKFVQGLKTERHERIALITGIRKNESGRRGFAQMSVPVQRKGAYLWLNPILDWEPADKNTYMAAHDLPRNPVVDLLHRSGECLCGALARREELRDIALWYPDAAEPIFDLEGKAKDLRIGDRFWAMRSPVSADQEELLPDEMLGSPLCSDCNRNAVPAGVGANA